MVYLTCSIGCRLTAWWWLGLLIYHRLSFTRSRWGWILAHWMRGRVQPVRVACSSQGWRLKTNTHIQSHLHIHGQFRVTNSPNLKVFGLWEEANMWREPTDTGRTYKLHTDREDPGIDPIRGPPSTIHTFSNCENKRFKTKFKASKYLVFK